MGRERNHGSYPSLSVYTAEQSICKWVLYTLVLNLRSLSLNSFPHSHQTPHERIRPTLHVYAFRAGVVAVSNAPGRGRRRKRGRKREGRGRESFFGWVDIH